jgi:cysteine-rich repeat protein
MAAMIRTGLGIVLILSLSCTTKFKENEDGDEDAEVEAADDAAEDTAADDAETTGECGNGEVEAPEECDDGNDVNGDGCEGDCTFSCHGNDDCDDGNFCNGAETCSAETDAGRRCLEGTARPEGTGCNDGLFCTAGDTCDGEGNCRSGEENPCVDGFDCTSEDCDEGADACPFTAAEGTCFIEETCYGVGDRDPDNTCYACGPDAHDWTLLDPGTPCDDMDTCTWPDRCGDGGACAGEVLASPEGALSLCAGPEHTCGVFAGGAVKCWGAGNQSGDGMGGGERPVPVDVVGLSHGAVMVSCGEYHTCAVMESGGVKCWGDNIMGQLGDGTTEGAAAPVDVTGLPAPALSVGCSSRFSCAALSSGRVFCWGQNANGVLAVDPFAVSSSPLPVEVGGMSENALSVAAGSSHVCALLEGGFVKCWGGNFYGQLGMGGVTADPALTPILVTNDSAGTNPLPDAVQVTCGSFHACAVTDDGMGSRFLYCWGYNYQHQLGFDSSPASENPYAGLVTVVAGQVREAAAGSAHTCAVMQDGAVMCWGENSRGQLGGGNTSPTNLGVQVRLDASSFLVDAVTAGAGFTHTCAYSGSLKTRCWGSNARGELGNDDLGVESAFAVQTHCR